MPPGENSIKGKGAKVVRIIESAELTPEIQTAFTAVEIISLKPVIYLGKQIVRGENHLFICEAKAIYPGAQPRAVILGINIFEGKPSIVGIVPIIHGR